MIHFYVSTLKKNFLECFTGKYGFNCKENCSIHCGVPERCDRVTGKCEGGCQPGWSDLTCKTSKDFSVLFCIFLNEISY